MRDLTIKQRVAGAVLIVVLAVLFVPIILLLESQPDAPVVPVSDRADPIETREQVSANAKALLTTYGWIDKAKGTVRVPVTRARALWLEANGGAR